MSGCGPAAVFSRTYRYEPNQTRTPCDWTALTLLTQFRTVAGWISICCTLLVIGLAVSSLIWNINTPRYSSNDNDDNTTN